MKTVKISPPWIQYVNKINALFDRDKEVKLIYDNDNVELKLFVDDNDKAEAIAAILPSEKKFGNVTLKITVLPSNTDNSVSSVFVKAFKGNPVLKDVTVISDAFTNPVTYCVFEKTVVQYYDDNLGDPYGLKSTLYQDIANEIFEKHDGVLFCTAKTENSGWE